MKKTQNNYLITLIDNKSQTLNCNNKSSVKKKYARSLSRFVKIYGNDTKFITRIKNLFLRLIDLFKFFKGISSRQIASSFMICDLKSNFGNSSMIIQESVNTIDNTPLTKNILKYEQWLSRAVRESHKTYMKYLIANQHSIAKIQLKILQKSSHIQANSQSDFNGRYQNIVQEEFKTISNQVAKTIADDLVKKIPNLPSVNAKKKSAIHRQLHQKISASVHKAFDPLSIV